MISVNKLNFKRRVLSNCNGSFVFPHIRHIIATPISKTCKTLTTRRSIIRQQATTSKQQTAPSSDPPPSHRQHIKTRNLILALDHTDQLSKWACQWVINNMYMPGDVIHVIRVGEWSNYNSLPFLPDGSLPSYFPTNNMSSHQHTDPTNTFTNSEKELEEQCAKVFGELGQQNSIPYCTHVLDAAGGEGSRGGGSTTTTISATPFFSDKDCIADVICSKAAELHAAAIIVTSRTRSTIARLTQGSVADRCIHHCSQPGGGSRSGHGGGDEEGGESIPVILLNPPLSTPDNNNNNKSDITSTSLPPLIKKKSRKTVIVAVDDNAVSQRAVKWAANHLVDKTKNNDTFLRLIHITQSPSLSPFLLHPLDSAPSFLPVELNLTEDEVREAAQQALTPLFQPILQGGGERKEDGLQWKLDVVMVALGDGVGGVGGALCAAAEEELKKKKKEEGGIGVEVVLVVGSEAHGGLSEFLLGSVATYVEHHASVPLVVVH